MEKVYVFARKSDVFLNIINKMHICAFKSNMFQENALLEIHMMVVV